MELLDGVTHTCVSQLPYTAVAEAASTLPYIDKGVIHSYAVWVVKLTVLVGTVLVPFPSSNSSSYPCG